MYLALSNIVIQQIPTDKWPDRKKAILFSFLNSYECESTWENLTQTMKIVLPKKVKVRYIKWSSAPFTTFPDFSQGVVDFYNITVENSNIGGFNKEPVLLRGDLITFNVGYRTYLQPNNAECTYMTGGPDPTGKISGNIPDTFKGYISKVDPKLPFTIECEDNMWLLKQMPTPAKQWKNGTTINDIISTVIKDSQSLPIIQRYKGYMNLTVSDHSVTDLKFNVNNFTTTRGSLSALMARLKSEYRIYSYFRGDSLRVGYTYYIPEESVTHEFTFQKNIIADNLTWQRKDDLVLSAIVKSHYSIEGEGTTKDGVTKTKQASTEILIYNNAGQFSFIKKEKGANFPTKYLNDIGERFTFNIYSPIDDVNTLFEYGKKQLQKKYYDGFKGSFTTFGIPYVKHGDTVKIIDMVLTERTGEYKVKGVKAHGGFGTGYRQEIILDHKL